MTTKQPTSLDCLYSFSRMIQEVAAYRQMLDVAASDIYWHPLLTMGPIERSGKHGEMLERVRRYRAIRKIIGDDLPERPVKLPPNMRPDWDYQSEL
jgi:hypothetical protein